jgi:hypothetical protein
MIYLGGWEVGSLLVELENIGNADEFLEAVTTWSVEN